MLSERIFLAWAEYSDQDMCDETPSIEYIKLSSYWSWFMELSRGQCRNPIRVCWMSSRGSNNKLYQLYKDIKTNSKHKMLRAISSWKIMTEDRVACRRVIDRFCDVVIRCYFRFKVKLKYTWFTCNPIDFATRPIARKAFDDVEVIGITNKFDLSFKILFIEWKKILLQTNVLQINTKKHLTSKMWSHKH